MLNGVVTRDVWKPVPDSHGSSAATKKVVSRPALFAGGAALSVSSVLEPVT